MTFYLIMIGLLFFTYNNNLIAVMIPCATFKNQSPSTITHKLPLTIALRELQGQIQALRMEGLSLRAWAEEAAGGAQAVAGEWAGKVGHLVFRQAR